MKRTLVIVSMILSLAFVGRGASSEESNAVSSTEGKYSATF